MNDSKRQNGKRTIYRIIAGVCLVLGIAAVAFVARYLTVRNRTEDLYESLQHDNAMETQPRETGSDSSDRNDETKASDNVTEVPTAPPLPDDEYMLRSIDFDQLLTGVNADIYAWIWIPETKIDYPVFQHESDNAWYLRHNPDGSEGFPGCIYTEKENAKDFTDFNTLIYGHNMKDGSMFHDLRSYADAEWMQDHRYVYIYQQGRVLKYEVFAAYEYDNRHLLYAFSYETRYDRLQYIEEVLNQRNMTAVFNTEAEVNTNSKIITMSTCVHAEGPERYLVQAVLIDEYVFIDSDF